jgi:SNF2 family DNA or RNA helicase
LNEFALPWTKPTATHAARAPLDPTRRIVAPALGAIAPRPTMQRPTVKSWRPPLAPAIHNVELLAAPPTISPRSWRLAVSSLLVRRVRSKLRIAAPLVVSMPMRSPQLPVASYLFPQPLDPPSAAAAIEPASAPAATSLSKSSPTSRSTTTRVAPPGDVIKLHDRLHYLLQPSLEGMLAEGQLTFPHEPFPFQLQGIAFLYPRYAAILADEMGLGKTMQAIAATRLLLHTGDVRSVLLICPKPLASNWQREFAHWAPEIPVSVIEGDQSRRRWQWRQPGAPVKVANYESVLRDRDLFDEEAMHFDLVILDEAQRIKNRSSGTSHAIRSISRKRSWALTGTPVENSAEDLVGIFEFLSPGFLNAEMKPRAMGRAASDYVLRRTKQEVLTDLPPKLVRDAELYLTPEQRHSYELAEEQGVLRLTEMGDQATIQHVFELVLRLKQICNFDPATGASSKLERLTADLEEVAASGQKAIVFSQWVQTLTPLSRALRRFGPLEYHGRTPAKRRDEILTRFREDPRCHVLLMSYGAGAVGLNLQFAGYVFLFDRWWNPAVEDQAINRAHRIGASGPVTVSRFLMAGTIEERIDQVLQEKRELFDAILSDANPKQLGLSQSEIFGLFRLPRRGDDSKSAA